MSIVIRNAELADLDVLYELERACFPSFQQLSKKALQHSIKSDSQDIVVGHPSQNRSRLLCICIVLKYKHSVRITSIATSPKVVGKGIGTWLLQYILLRYKKAGYTSVLIEVLRANRKLVNWYSKRGFVPVKILPNYYKKDLDAVKMIYRLQPAKEQKSPTDPLFTTAGAQLENA